MKYLRTFWRPTFQTWYVMPIWLFVGFVGGMVYMALVHH